MAVSGVNNAGLAALTASVTSGTNSTGNTTNDLIDSVLNPNEDIVDTYEKSEPEKKTTYTRDSAKIAELNAGQKAYISNLQSMVSELVKQVGSNQAAGAKVSYANVNGKIDPGRVESYWDLVVDNGDGTYTFDPSLSLEDQEKIIAKAQEDVSEDGYYGVKQTSQRILDFAKAVTGGDPDKIDDMRKMAEKAFDEVKNLTGGKLPELSQKTYDAVMKGFDEWEASAKAN